MLFGDWSIWSARTLPRSARLRYRGVVWPTHASEFDQETYMGSAPGERHRTRLSIPGSEADREARGR